MEFKDIKDVLTFAAFKPDPDYYQAPWEKRFAGQRALLLNVNKSSVSWMMVDKKGNFIESAEQDGDFMEVVASRGEEWRSATDGGWIGISINSRFIISLESNLSRKAGYLDAIRTNPRSVIGAKYDRGKRYAIQHNPDTSASLLLAIDDSLIRSVEEGLKAQNLRAARISCGLFAMVTDFLRRLYESKGDEAKSNFVLIACLGGSICVLGQKSGQWTELRCRSGIYTDDIAPVTQIIDPLLKSADPSTKVYFLNENPGDDFSQQMMAHLAPTNARDITADDHLWNVIGSN